MHYCYDVAGVVHARGITGVDGSLRPKSNQCRHCGKFVSQSRNLPRHENSCPMNANPLKILHLCNICDAIFTRSDSLRGHLRNVHFVGEKLICPKCRAPIRDEGSLERHIQLCVPHGKTK